MTNRKKYLIGGAVALAAVAAFAAFRPDTLFTDKTVNDTLEPGVAAALDASSTSPAPPTTGGSSSVPPAAETGATTSSSPPPTTVPQPTVAATGEWTSIEHETTGTVAVVVDGPKSTVVMNDLTTSNGPDLVVYLSPVSTSTGGDYTAGAIQLGPLKGNLGTQTYDLPPGTIASDFASIVIWCDRFSVGFGAAGLTPA